MRRLVHRILRRVRARLGAPVPSFHTELRRALEAQQPVGLRAGTFARALELRSNPARVPGDPGRAH